MLMAAILVGVADLRPDPRDRGARPDGRDDRRAAARPEPVRDRGRAGPSTAGCCRSTSSA